MNAQLIKRQRSWVEGNRIIQRIPWVFRKEKHSQNMWILESIFIVNRKLSSLAQVMWIHSESELYYGYRLLFDYGENSRPIVNKMGKCKKESSDNVWRF